MKSALLLLLVGVTLANGQLLSCPKDAVKTMLTKVTKLQFSEVRNLLTDVKRYGGESCLRGVMIGLTKLGQKTTPMADAQCTDANVAQIFCMAKRDSKDFLLAKRFCGTAVNDTKLCTIIKQKLFGSQSVCAKADDKEQQKAWAVLFTSICSGSKPTTPNAKILAYLYSSKTAADMTTYLAKFTKADIDSLVKELVSNPKIFASLKNCIKFAILKIAKAKGVLGDYITTFTNAVSVIKTKTPVNIGAANKEILNIVRTIVPYLPDTDCTAYKTSLVDKLAEVIKSNNWKNEFAKKDAYYECDKANSVARKPAAQNESAAFRFLKDENMKVFTMVDPCPLKCGKKLFTAVTAGSSDTLGNVDQKLGDLVACADKAYLSQKLNTLQSADCTAMSDRLKEMIKANTLELERANKCKPMRPPANYTALDFIEQGCSAVCSAPPTDIKKYVSNPDFCDFWVGNRTTCRAVQGCEKFSTMSDDICKQRIPKVDRPEGLKKADVESMTKEDIKTAMNKLEGKTRKNSIQRKMMWAAAKKKGEDFGAGIVAIADMIKVTGKDEIKGRPGNFKKNVDKLFANATAEEMKSVAQAFKGRADSKYLGKKILESVQNGETTFEGLKTFPGRIKSKMNLTALAISLNKTSEEVYTELAAKDDDEGQDREDGVGRGKAGADFMIGFKNALDKSGTSLCDVFTLTAIEKIDASALAFINGTHIDLLNQTCPDSAKALLKKIASDPYYSCGANKKKQLALARKAYEEFKDSGADLADVAQFVAVLHKEGEVTAQQVISAFFSSGGLDKLAENPLGEKGQVMVNFVKEGVKYIDFDAVTGNGVTVMMSNDSTITPAQKEKCDRANAENTNQKSENERGRQQRHCKRAGASEADKQESADFETKFVRAHADSTQRGNQLISGTSSGRRRRAVTVYTCSTLQQFANSEVVSRMTVENINGMASSEFSSCIAHLGSITGWSTIQYTALFEKAMTELSIASPYSTLSSTETSVIGTMVHGLTSGQISGLTNMASIMIDLGVLSEWSSAQLSAIATKYMSVSSVAQSSSLTSTHLIEMGHAVCGLTSAQITSIQGTEYMDAATTVNNMTTAETSCLSALATLSQDANAYGAATSWNASTFEAAGILLGGLTADALNAADADAVETWGQHISVITPAVFQLLSTDVLRNFAREDTVYVTSAQRATLSTDQLNALAVAEAGLDGSGAVVYTTTGSSAVGMAASMVTMVVTVVTYYMM